jgi:hypothetical protein
MASYHLTVEEDEPRVRGSTGAVQIGREALEIIACAAGKQQAPGDRETPARSFLRQWLSEIPLSLGINPRRRPAAPEKPPLVLKHRD